MFYIRDFENDDYENNEFENWVKEQKEWQDYLIKLKQKLKNNQP